ncbi:MAG: sugar ABC transporter ATP-binding protein [Pararhodobacter sp.]
MQDDPPLTRAEGLEIRGLAKSFGATRALRGVDLDLLPGQVHALIGENGAGKSTLIKIVCGVQTAGQGSMLLAGQPFAPTSPAMAAAQGVILVPQELRIIPAMTAAENVFLPDWPMRRAFGVLPQIDHGAMRRGFARLMAGLDVTIDPDCPARDLPFAERQLLVIARALRREARLLILDEPTASLERAEVARLFATINQLRHLGVAVVFISHRLEEVEEIADSVTVLRDGAVVARHQRGGFRMGELVQAMTGRDLDAMAAAHWREAGAERLSAQVALRTPPAQPVSVQLSAGRATGLAGLLGAGGDRLLRRLFGAAGPQDVVLDGQAQRLAAPIDAIARGIGYVASERSLGILPKLSVADNIALPHLRLSRRPDRARIMELITLLDIRPANPDMAAGGLSGGNQQKVLFARWLIGRPAVMLLDEPTHGVDIGAKATIHRLIHDYVADGGAALIHSAEFHELLNLSDEVIALRGGEVVRRLARDQAGYTEQDLRATLGG